MQSLRSLPLRPAKDSRTKEGEVVGKEADVRGFLKESQREAELEVKKERVKVPA